MTSSGLPQFVAAVIDRLRSSSTFMQGLAGVFDEVPSRASYPHVIVDEPFETPDRTFGQDGHSSTVTLSIFTQSPSTTKGGDGRAGFAPGLAIANEAIALLTDIENNSLDVDGHDVVDVDVVTIDCTRESDGLTRRVDVTITATLEDAA